MRVRERKGEIKKKKKNTIGFVINLLRGEVFFPVFR